MKDRFIQDGGQAGFTHAVKTDGRRSAGAMLPLSLQRSGQRSGQTLRVHRVRNSFSVVARSGKFDGEIVARGIPQRFMAEQFCAMPELIDAAIFAASVLMTGDLAGLGEQLAFQKLTAALARANLNVETLADGALDAIDTVRAAGAATDQAAR